MRITTKKELLDVLEWATGESSPMSPLDTDPPVDTPQRYAGGDPTYKPPKYASPHRDMEQTHFYYAGMGAGNKLRTLVYWEDNTVALPVSMLKKWIDDARNGGGGTPHKRFSAVEWRKPGFLVFFIDMPGWNFLEKTVQGVSENRALYFAEVMDSNGNKISHPNHSFYNARTFNLQTDSDSFKLLVVENHHLKAPGTTPNYYQHRPLGDTSIDEYKYDIFLTLDIEKGNTNDVFPIILDPGGRNMGPP
jgi:hypothetical protein